MRERLSSMAFCAILLGAAVALAACSSQEGIKERRARLQASGGFVEESAEGAREEATPGVAEEATTPEVTDESALPNPTELAGARSQEEPAVTAGGDENASEYMKILRRKKEAERKEAEYYKGKGDDALANGRFQEAIDHYDRALALNPSLEEARKGRNKAGTMLGLRGAESPEALSNLSARRKVERDQRVKEIQVNRDKARNALADGELDQAEEFASLANEMIQLQVELLDSSLAKEVKALLDEIRASKKSRAAADAERRRDIAEKEAREQEAEMDRRKHERVQELLRKSLRALNRGEYTKVVELCDAILEIEPENQVAAFWKRSSEDHLLNERRLKIVMDRMENRELQDQSFLEALNAQSGTFKFPDREFWEERVVPRATALRDAQTFDEPRAIQVIRQQLEGTTVDQINFDDTPFREVVNTFRRIAGVNIVIDPEVGADGEEFNVTQPISGLSAMAALRLILQSKNLGLTFQENALFITTADDAGADTIFDVYNVSDLLMKIKNFEAPQIQLKSAGDATSEEPITFTDDVEEEEGVLDADQLIELIQEATGGDEVWGENNTMQPSKMNLLVNASRELHRKVQDVLQNLRKDSDLFVVIEARFIDIFDDFLEDIGIDSRSLGEGDNLGIPFGGPINDSSTGGNDLGFVEQGELSDIELVAGLERWAGRVQHIIDGFTGTIAGERVNGGGGVGGGTFQATWLEPFQINTILRAVQEEQDVRQLTAPVVTAHNNERVYVSVITQRAYIADYELVSGGTGFAIIEVADPIVQTFQEGVILDVDPTISHDKKYVTLDVRPTLATLIGGIISTIQVSLGSFTQTAFMVPIGIPQIALQQSFTSVTVPNGGTVLLGGFKSLNETKLTSYLPILGKIPILKNLARRKATVSEKRSLVILLTARIVDLRGEEASLFNPE